MEELKPCPFCGGRAVVHVDGGVTVICTDCRCRTVILEDGIAQGRPTGSAVEHVIKKWNLRVAEI